MQWQFCYDDWNTVGGLAIPTDRIILSLRFALWLTMNESTLINLVEIKWKITQSITNAFILLSNYVSILMDNKTIPYLSMYAWEMYR